jgi:hypothetical protein
MVPLKRRSNKRRLNKVRVTFALLAVVLIAGLPILWCTLRRIGSPNQYQSRISGESVRTASSKPGEPKARRSVFKYSVVAGGVQSAAELTQAADRDPVVRDHYKDIHLNQVRELHLDKDMRAYVSYRVKDKVYWTQKKIPLRKGELVLTDGKNLVRSRCGNRISISRIVASPGPEPEDPQFDIEEPELPIAVSGVPLAFDILPAGGLPPSDVQASVAPYIPPAVVAKAVPTSRPAALLPLLAPVAAIVGSSIAGGSSNHSAGIIRSSQPPVTVAPEPSANVWLLAIGLGWLVMRSRRRIFKRMQ